MTIVIIIARISSYNNSAVLAGVVNKITFYIIYKTMPTILGLSIIYSSSRVIYKISDNTIYFACVVINRSARVSVIAYKIACDISDCSIVINCSAISIISRSIVAYEISSDISNCSRIINRSAVVSMVADEISGDISNCSIIKNRSTRDIIRRCRRSVVTDEIACNIAYF